MKVLMSRVILCATISGISICAGGARATTPAEDFKTLTSKAYVDYMVDENAVDLSAHAVNGAPLSNSSSYFYDGAAGGTASSTTKTASISSITALNSGTVITVQPTTTSTVAASTLTLNSFAAKPMYYNGAAVTANNAGIVWNSNYPSTFVYDGTVGNGGAWVFMGHGVDIDTDTTYGAMNSLASPTGTDANLGGIAGTSTTDTVVSPRVLKNVIQNTTLTANTAGTGETLGTFTATDSAITASDTVIGAFGKAQGQINSISSSVGSLDDAFDGLIKSSINGVYLKSLEANDAVFYGLGQQVSGGNSVNVEISNQKGSPVDGQVIVVRMKATFDSTGIESTVNNNGVTLVLNRGGKVRILYAGANLNSTTAPIVLNKSYPSIFMYSKSAGVWNFVGSGIDLPSHTVNGAPLLNATSVFYGTGAGAADATTKTASITGITTLDTGIMITVQPSVTSTVGASTLNLNSLGAKPMYYNGAAVTADNAGIVWNSNYPSTFVYDGTNWVFIGHGVDNDTGATLAGNMVNGAPLSNATSVFYGTGAGAADATAKTASITGITTLDTGIMITVQPSVTSTVGASTLNLNSLGAKPMYYNGAAVTADNAGIVWNSNYPSTFVYDGTNWVFMGHGIDKDTTYGAMNSLARPTGMDVNLGGIAGTSKTNAVISPRVLKNVIQNTTLTANTADTGEILGAFRATNSAITALDTVIGAFGKAQGQINARQKNVPAVGTYLNSSLAETAVSDYDAAAVKGTALVTKTSTAGAVGERMIVDSGTDTTNWATAKLNNAIPSMSKLNAVVSSVQSEKVCYEYAPGTAVADQSDATCWLWTLP